MSSIDEYNPNVALCHSLGQDERFVFLVGYINRLESILMCQQKEHEKQLKEVRDNCKAKMKVLEEKIHTHSVILHEELTRQEEEHERILRIQCFWRRKMAIRARIKLEHVISVKVVAEAARVAIEANQYAMKFVGNALADVAAVCARATAQKKWCDAMSASWSAQVCDKLNSDSDDDLFDTIKSDSDDEF